MSWDPSLCAAHIGVTAADGVVTLTGHDDRFAEKHAADVAAYRVKSVKAVCEEIVVRLPLDHDGDDDQIACEALCRLAWHAVDPDFAVMLHVERGRITLSGHVA